MTTVSQFSTTNSIVQDQLEGKPNKRELEKYKILSFSYNIMDLDSYKEIYLKYDWCIHFTKYLIV